ncbi:MAG: stalk domain-containing protein [bacterium]|nr:stalk domain-containing protein [bacterium]
MRKFIAAAAAAAVFSCSAAASADEVQVYINQKQVEFDQPPVILNDLTYVPFRAIFEDLGMVVQWHDDEKRASAYNKSYNISFIMGYDCIFLNGVGYSIPHGPVIYNSRMLVPLRALIEGIHGSIYWDEASGSVYIDSSEAVNDDEWAQELLRLTNDIRIQNGLNPLVWDDELAEVGRVHCMDMAAREYFDHNTPEGLTPFDRMHNAGIWPVYAGENIAAGQINPADVTEAWMNSPEHRDNILNPNFTRLGAAFFRGGNLGIYWAQEFS